jgi:hypothetical protein
VEVYAEMAFEQAQHRRVAVINGSTCGRDSCIVLAAEALSQKSQCPGTAAVARCHKQAGVADASSLGAVGWSLANRCAGDGGLTMAGSIPLQNHCIDGERGGWSWCESC